MSHHRQTETKSWSIQTQDSLPDLHRWEQYGGGSSTSQSRIIDFESRTLTANENAKHDSGAIFKKEKPDKWILLLTYKLETSHSVTSSTTGS